MVELGGGAPPRMPLTQVVRAGPLLFVSGQVPVTSGSRDTIPDGVQAQTRVVLERIRELLEGEGCSLSQVVKTTVYLSDVSLFAEMNQVYVQYFPNRPPARTTIGALLAVDALVEIDAIAVLGER